MKVTIGALLVLGAGLLFAGAFGDRADVVAAAWGLLGCAALISGWEDDK